jgi:hypothetical protein
MRAFLNGVTLPELTQYKSVFCAESARGAWRTTSVAKGSWAMPHVTLVASSLNNGRHRAK